MQNAPSTPPLEAENSDPESSPGPGAGIWFGIIRRCVAAFLFGFIVGSGQLSEMLAALSLP